MRPSVSSADPVSRQRLTSRALTVVGIILCFQMGVLLLVFPWLSPWTKNFFVTHYPWVSVVARNYFVRGAISGIGLADLGLAIYEYRQFRRRGRAAR